MIDLPESVEYLQKIPAATPPARVVVHNHVQPPTRRLGLRGFRAWFAPLSDRLEVCDCGWAPEIGEHYRVVRTTLEADNESAGARL